MKCFKGYMNLASVKIFATSVIFFGLFGNYAKAELSISDAANEANNKRAACLEYQNNLREARRMVSDACKDSNLGDNKKCITASFECADVSGQQAFNNFPQLLGQVTGDPAIGAMSSALTSNNMNQMNSSCPQMSGTIEAKSITDDIDKTNEDLADLVKEKADVQDNFNQEIKKLQEDLNKAQSELEVKKLEIKEKKRKQLADFQSQQNQAKEELRKKSSEVLSLQGQLIQSQQDQALKLIAMTEASGQRGCMKAVADAKKGYDAISSGSSRNYIQQAKSKKQDLINLYNDCMDSFLLQRNALNKAKKQEQDQLSKSITDTQQSIEELKNSLTSAQAQLTEMQNDAQKEEDNATADVAKLMQKTQTDMLAAQQKMQTNLQAIAQKDMNLRQKLARKNNDLTKVGPIAVNKAASGISTGVDQGLEAINFLEDPKNNCNYKPTGSEKSLFQKYQDRGGIRD